MQGCCQRWLSSEVAAPAHLQGDPGPGSPHHTLQSRPEMTHRIRSKIPTEFAQWQSDEATGALARTCCRTSVECECRLDISCRLTLHLNEPTIVCFWRKLLISQGSSLESLDFLHAAICHVWRSPCSHVNFDAYQDSEIESAPEIDACSC